MLGPDIQHLEVCTQASRFLSPWVKNMKNSSLTSVYLVALALRGIAGGSWSLRIVANTLGACCHLALLVAVIRRNSRKSNEAVPCQGPCVVCLSTSILPAQCRQGLWRHCLGVLISPVQSRRLSYRKALQQSREFILCLKHPTF